MIIISDTSVISGLIKVKQLSILKDLFSEILIPPTVKSELEELKRFEYDLTFFENADWIIVRKPNDFTSVSSFEPVLDRGEAEAIILAKELSANYLLIDEKKGRRIAEEEGLTVIGLAGILIRAKQIGIIPVVKPLLDDLVEHNFRIGTSLYNVILNRAGEGM